MLHANDSNYADLVKEGVVIVDFYGKTCGPCKMIAPVLEDIEDEFPFVTIVKADIEECPVTSDAFGITGIPDLYYYKDGEMIFHQAGAVGKDEILSNLAGIMY